MAEPKSDKRLNETSLTNGQFEVHPEHCKVHTVEACASEDHFLPLDNEKAEVTKVEQKRDQPPLAAEEGKEEGEISNDDDTETVQTSEGERMKQEGALGSLNQYVFIVKMSRLLVVIENSRSGSLSKSSVLCCSLPGPSSPPSPLSAGGRKKYSRDHLLSLRFLKECLEPPEGLFLNPGAIALVKRVGGDLSWVMGGGRVHPQDFPGPRDKKGVWASVSAHACVCVCMWGICVCICVCVCVHV